MLWVFWLGVTTDVKSVDATRDSNVRLSVISEAWQFRFAPVDETVSRNKRPQELERRKVACYLRLLISIKI